uniref:Uncharacterized protein n=1 Tax=Medicago truncatula TaxID=3880 RepID=I3SHU2_MEDTR|nr:unknown [Medicago truncatula]
MDPNHLLRLLMIPICVIRVMKHPKNLKETVLHPKQMQLHQSDQNTGMNITRSQKKWL